MIGNPRKNQALSQGVPRVSKAARINPPMGGVNVTVAIGSQDMNFCPYTYNLMPKETGMEVRKGYAEWCIDLERVANMAFGVRTVIPFERSLASGSKLFAVTNEGIWDVTVQNTPVDKVTFIDQTSTAGYGVYTHYVTDAGVEVMFYADSVNGLFSYNPLTNVWAATTGITGITAANVIHVVAHKQRIWLAIKNSANGYYLPVGAIAGAATAVPFGSKFKHGGNLTGLFTWTVDGGAGVDDYLVAVSSAGDVLPYIGADPTDTSWQLVGSFFIGKIPTKSRRFATDAGGELFLLSVFGVVSLNDLLQGVDSNVLQANAGSSLTSHIAGTVRQATSSKLNDEGWQITTIPSEGGLLILEPQGDSFRPVQYYVNAALRAWSFWRDVPMISFDSFQDSVYFGTVDNRIMKMTGAVDNALITPADPLDNGVAIEHSILTYFTSLGEDATFKRPKLVRPDYLAAAQPSSNTICRYDYNIAEGTSPSGSGTAGAATGSSLWGTAEWDVGVWGSAAAVLPTIHYSSTNGVWGQGRYIAVATKGITKSATILVGWDVVYDIGGVLAHASNV